MNLTAQHIVLGVSAVVLAVGAAGGLCEQSPTVPHVRAEQLQLLQQGPAAATAEPWAVLGALWESGIQRGNNF